MGAELFPSMDIEALERELVSAIDSAGSLREIETRLRSHQFIKSVELTDYLLKSNPPQRDFIVEFAIPDSSTVTKIVNIFDLGNGHFRFHELRDQ